MCATFISFLKLFKLNSGYDYSEKLAASGKKKCSEPMESAKLDLKLPKVAHLTVKGTFKVLFTKFKLVKGHYESENFFVSIGFNILTVRDEYIPLLNIFCLPLTKIFRFIFVADGYLPASHLTIK